VWGKLTCGLAGLDLPVPLEKALRDLRRRLGPAPLKALFEVVAGPLAWPRTPGTRFGSLRTVAFDGCNSLKIADTARNRAWAGKGRGSCGEAAYPALRLMTLAETGTRALLGAVAGNAAGRDEATLARQLMHLLAAGMLVLAGRAFDTNRFLSAVAGTGADLLIRVKSTRTPLVIAHLDDGSFLSDIGGLTVRIIAARIDTAGADGSRAGGCYRFITTLTGHRRYPAEALVQLYHERREIETAFLALRHTLLGGRVLRPGDPPGVQQELWALLTVYQLLRMAMVTAAETRPGTDPDRASFTTAMQTAIGELTSARGIIPPPGPPDLAGAIGRALLATLAPRPPPPLQHPHHPVPHLPLLQPRRHPPHHHNNHHHHNHHRHPPATHRPDPRTPPAHPLPPPHHHHHRQPQPHLDRPRPRRPHRRQPQDRSLPARRMGPRRLPHPNQPRNLQTQPQHTSKPSILDNNTRPLTTWHWIATGQK
jgi:hypothetical protein